MFLFACLWDSKLSVTSVSPEQCLSTPSVEFLSDPLTSVLWKSHLPLSLGTQAEPLQNWQGFLRAWTSMPAEIETVLVTWQGNMVSTRVRRQKSRQDQSLPSEFTSTYRQKYLSLLVKATMATRCSLSSVTLFPMLAICTCYLADPSTPMGLLCTTPTDLSPRQQPGLLQVWPGPSWLTIDKQA